MPTYTNRYGLPDWEIARLSMPYAPNPERIGVTELIDSPLVRKLKLRYWEGLVWDYSDFLARDAGSLKHAALEGTPPDGFTAEMKIETQVAGLTVAGRIDLFGKGLVIDHKFCKVGYATMHKDELESQLNVYAEMLRRAGHTVTGLYGCLHYDNWDWKLAKFHCPYPYPPIKEEILPVDLWSAEKAETYIANRVAKHLDPSMTMCDAEERWASPDGWAVMVGQKPVAKRVCQSEEMAQMYIAERNLKDAWVQRRPGGSLRCQYFCDLAQVCGYAGENGYVPSSISRG